MDFEAVKKVVGSGSLSGRILAEVIVSTYWQDKKMSLYSLMNLDDNARRLFSDIMNYRTTDGWNDHQFHKLALYAQDVIMPPLLTPIKPLIRKNNK